MGSNRSAKLICSHIGLALFTMMVVWQGSAAIIQIGMGANLPKNDWMPWILNSLPMYLLGVPAYLLLLYFVPNGWVQPRPRGRFGPGKFILAMIFCLGTSYFINIAGNAFIMLLRALAGRTGAPLEGMEDMMGGDSLLPTLVFGVLVPAIGEEFLFRYMILKKMRGCSDGTYIFFSAFCFALFHGNLTQSLYTFVGGAVFAWAYVACGRLWVPMLLHFVFNLLGLVAMPALLESEVGGFVFIIVALVLAVTALVLFCVFRKRVMARLWPATEDIWVPWQWVQMPVPVYTPTAYPHVPASAHGQGYAAWYGNCAAGASSYMYYGYYNGRLVPTGQIYQPWAQGYYPAQAYGGYMASVPQGSWLPRKIRAECLGNVGMVLFMALTGLLILGTFLMMVFV